MNKINRQHYTWPNLLLTDGCPLYIMTSKSQEKRNNLKNTYCLLTLTIPKNKMHNIHLRKDEQYNAII